MPKAPKNLPMVRLCDENDPGPAPYISVTVNEACRITGMGRTSLYDAICSGKIDAVSVDRRTLVMMDSLMDYLISLPRIRYREPNEDEA